jgi:hypothetical protein
MVVVTAAVRPLPGRRRRKAIRVAAIRVTLLLLLLPQPRTYLRVRDLLCSSPPPGGVLLPLRQVRGPMPLSRRRRRTGAGALLPELLPLVRLRRRRRRSS